MANATYGIKYLWLCSLGSTFPLEFITVTTLLLPGDIRSALLPFKVLFSLCILSFLRAFGCHRNVPWSQFYQCFFHSDFFSLYSNMLRFTKEPLSWTNWSNKVIATVSQLWPQSVRFIQVWKTLWEMIIFIYSIKWKSDKNWWPWLMQWATRVLKPYSRRKPEEAWLCFSVIYFKSDFNLPTSTFQDCKWVEGLTWPVWYKCISLIGYQTLKITPWFTPF